MACRVVKFEQRCSYLRNGTVSIEGMTLQMCPTVKSYLTDLAHGPLIFSDVVQVFSLEVLGDVGRRAKQLDPVIEGQRLVAHAFEAEKRPLVLVDCDLGCL